MNLYTPYSQRLGDLIKNSTAIKMKGEKEGTSVEVDTLDAYAGRKVFYGGKLSQLYQHNSEIFQRVLYHRNKPDNDWIVDRVIGEAAVHDTAFKSYQVRMFPVMVGHLKEMVDYAKAKGVEVKLVINPYFPQFAETVRDSFLTPLKTAVEGQTGMTVSDFSTALQSTDEIGDYQHANKKGSTHYMNVLFENGIFNSLSNSNLGVNNVQEAGLMMVIPSVDTVTSYPKETLPIVYPKDEPQPVSVPKENVSPYALEKPVLMQFAAKKVKKAGRKRQDDYGFSVDTVGLGR
jgi:hypothetical protein